MEPQLGARGGVMSKEQASALAREVILQSAMNATCIAYADEGLSLAGQNRMKSLGFNLEMNWENGAPMRMINWPGTPYLPLDDFAACVALLTQYNEFIGEVTVRVFRQLVAHYPKTGWRFRLAREGSVAVYIASTHYQYLEDAEVEALRVEMVADEAGYSYPGYRFWWD